MCVFFNIFTQELLYASLGTSLSVPILVTLPCLFTEGILCRDLKSKHLVFYETGGLDITSLLKHRSPRKSYLSSLLVSLLRETTVYVYISMNLREKEYTTSYNLLSYSLGHYFLHLHLIFKCHL